MGGKRRVVGGWRGGGKLPLIDAPERKVIRQGPVGRSPHGVWTLAHAKRI